MQTDIETDHASERQARPLVRRGRIAEIDLPLHHHPTRILDVLVDEERRARTIADEGWDPDPASPPTFVHPLDRLAQEAVGLASETFHDLRDGLEWEGTGCVHDLSMLTDEVLEAPPGFDFHDRGAGADADVLMYVHFGMHRFPSPFPEIGVDGAYVLVGEAEDDVASVRVVLTTSEAFSRDIPDVHITGSPRMRRRDASRILDLSWRHPKGTDLATATRLATEGGGPYVDAWRPCLDRALRAVAGSLAAIADPGHSVDDALCYEYDDETFAELSDAQGPEEVREAMLELARECEHMPVRFVGGIPPFADYEPNLGSPYPRTDSGAGCDPLDHLRSTLSDCDQPIHFWDFVALTRRAERIAGGIRSIPRDVEIDHLSKLLASECQYAENGSVPHGPEPYAAAVAVADRLMRLSDDAAFDPKLLAGVVRTLAPAGLDERARSAASKLEERVPGHPAPAVSRFYVECVRGDARAAMVEAVALAERHSGCVETLLGEDHGWCWEFDEPGMDAYRSALIFAGPLRNSAPAMSILRRAVEGVRLMRETRGPTGLRN